MSDIEDIPFSFEEDWDDDDDWDEVRCRHCGALYGDDCEAGCECDDCVDDT